MDDFETEDAELEAALSMESADQLAERARGAADDGHWFAAAALSAGAWRKANGLRVAPAPLLAHLRMPFQRPPVFSPPEL